jgi:hypothetical protein
LAQPPTGAGAAPPPQESHGEAQHDEQQGDAQHGDEQQGEQQRRWQQQPVESTAAARARPRQIWRKNISNSPL